MQDAMLYSIFPDFFVLAMVQRWLPLTTTSPIRMSVISLPCVTPTRFGRVSINRLGNLLKTPRT